MASLTETVPVLSTGGIAKEFLVPGWRLGWVLLHNRNGVFDEVGLTRVAVSFNTLILSHAHTAGEKRSCKTLSTRFGAE